VVSRSTNGVRRRRVARNVMFSQRGHLTLAHNDSSLRTMRWRTEVNKLQGVDSDLIGPAEIKKLVPYLDTSSTTRFPILGALYHPPGGTVRHDAVVWGFARAADAYGVHIHQQTEVVGIDVDGGRVTGVRTADGHPIATGAMLNATAGWSTLISDMVGVRMPVQTFPLQAAVTEPVKPFLDTVIVSGTLHVYVSQTDRGELVFGASVDPFASYSTRGSLEFAEGVSGHVLQLMPALSKMRLLRQWAGLCDMTPDLSPIMGPTQVDGFYVDVGWGTYGFKAGPVSGEAMADCIVNARPPEIISPFGLDRFTVGRLVGEKGAACPWCGARDASEFRYVGESGNRPDPATVTAEQWRLYLYFHANPRGWVRENWYHGSGCRRFFTVERHTVTNEVRTAGGRS
jgi:sarcosine oxidase, subunit beta